MKPKTIISLPLGNACPDFMSGGWRWALIIVFFLFSCRTSYFIVPDFAKKTKNHKTVAILPVEIIFTGKTPKKLTQQDIQKIEEGESKAFQISLYNNLLKNFKTTKGAITISFQPTEKTNSLLQENGIDIRNSWNTDVQKLCKILNVDAVVRTSVQKTRYMSDLASYGIELGTEIIDNLLWEVGAEFLPIYGTSKTFDINAQCSLFNASDGTLLWKDMYNRATDWRADANYIIENITEKFSKKFPYRKK